VLKELRRLQQSLGEAHDAQVLLDSLDELLPNETAGVSKPLLKQALEVEIERTMPRTVSGGIGSFASPRHARVRRHTARVSGSRDA